MRFSHVQLIEECEDETKVFGKRAEYGSLDNLFDLKTLATIGANLDDTENIDPCEVSVPSVLAASNANYLVVAVGDDISVFNLLSFGTYFLFTTSLPAGSRVCGLCLIGELGFVTVVTSSLRFIIISVAQQSVVFEQSLVAEIEKTTTVSITSQAVGDNCYLMVATDSGSIFSFTFSQWNRVVNAKPEDVVVAFMESLSNVSRKNVVTMDGAEDLCVSPSLDVILMSMKKSLMISYFGANSFGSLSDCEEMRYVKGRMNSDGRFVWHLTSDGILVLRDMWTMAAIEHIVVSNNPDEQVVDFLLIDENTDIGCSPKRIAVFVHTAKGLEMQVRSPGSCDVSYAVEVRPGTRLLSRTDSADRVFLLVEPMPEGKYVDDVVRVREVCEAAPETRFQRLINRGQLDDAEKFARQFGLDLQKVYVARMHDLMEKTCSESSDDVFKRLVETLDAVKDHNLVGEMCYSGATTFTKYERIVHILSYAKKRAISDDDTLNLLHRLGYVLATYRMIFGEAGVYERGDIWSIFVEAQTDEEWYNVFTGIFHRRLFNEARVVWARHSAAIVRYLLFTSEETMQDTSMANDNITILLTLINDVLTDDFSCWKNVIEMLEFDIFPSLLTIETIETLVSGLVRVLEPLVIRLELDSADWPLNALHVAQTINRTANRLVRENHLPLKKIVVTTMFSYMATGEGREYMDRMVELTRNLEAIAKLKSTYECPLDYQTFCSLTSEKICYRILQLAVKNPNHVTTNVAKHARPYMEEHRLDPDTTIFGFIKDVSSRSCGTVSASNPWDEHCLLVSETIYKPWLRSAAVIMIAKDAHPPWSKKLDAAVKAVLQSPKTDSDTRRGLEAVCRQAELTLYFLRYRTFTNQKTCDFLLTRPQMFIRALGFVCAAEKVEPDDAKRLTDCLQIMRLYMSLAENKQLLHEDLVYIFFFDHFVHNAEDDDVFCDRLFALLDNMAATEGDEKRKYVAEVLAKDFAARVNVRILSKKKKTIALRMRHAYVCASLIERFICTERNETYHEMRSIIKLQEVYGMFVVREQLRDRRAVTGLYRQYLSSGEKSLSEMYCFASALMLNKDDATLLTVDMATDMGDIAVLLPILRDAMLRKSEHSVALVEKYVVACEFILQSLPTIYADEHVPTEQIDVLIDQMGELDTILSDVVSFCTDDYQLQVAVIKMSSYVRLFGTLVEQCVLAVEANQARHSADGVAPVIKETSSKVMGHSRRLGCYEVANDGPLFEYLQAVPKMACVAPSIIRQKDSHERREERYGEQRDGWEILFQFLSLQGQDLLEYYCRVLASTLPCFEQCPANALVLYHETRNICERALLAHPCDLWLVTALIISQPVQKAQELMLSLRTFVFQRRAPQTLLNFLRVAQMVTQLMKDNNTTETLKTTFIRALWAKRLTRAGADHRLTKQPLTTVVSEFSKLLLHPSFVADFVKAFNGKGDVELLNYASVVIVSGAQERDDTRLRHIIDTSVEAVRSISLPPKMIFDRFQNIIYLLCPYNYKLLTFVVGVLKNNAKEEDDQDFVYGCERILSFISSVSRIHAPTSEECGWYLSREKQIQLDKKENSWGENIRLLYENGAAFAPDCSTMSTGDDRALYEREDTLVTSLPQCASVRLPFHLFLLRRSNDVEKHVRPIVDVEVAISTVQMWQQVTRKVSWLHASALFPRSTMLSSAVSKKCREAADRGEDVSDTELSTIGELLMSTTSRETVLSCVALCFNKLALSETKIRLLQMGVAVAEQWMANPNLKPPMDDDERSSICDQMTRLMEGIARYRTELILKKAALYDKNTMELVESPEELIAHIYAQLIDWTDPADIDRKCGVVKELASVNEGVDLATMQNELVFRWLPEGGSCDGPVQADLNDTMGLPVSAGGGMPIGSGDDGELVPMPINDPDIIRIVHLLVELNDPSMITKIARAYIKKIKDSSDVTGGYKSMCRAVCVLLRAYSIEVLAENKLSMDKLCNTLETSLYGHLLELSRTDIPLDQFMKTEREQFVRSLLAPSVRHTPMVSHFLTCLVLDNELEDRRIIELLLNKLHAARKREMLVVLLQRCRENERLARIPNLPLLWARVFDQILAEAESSHHNDVAELIRKCVLFGISCPVEGGRAFDTMRSALRQRGCPVAAHLTAVAGSNTQKFAVGDLTAMNPNVDFVFKWVDVEQLASGSSSQEKTATIGRVRSVTSSRAVKTEMDMDDDELDF